VDQRTRLAGCNRLELLLFRLAGERRFGINVFKVNEVLRCPPLTRLPDVPSVVRGMAHIRGSTVVVLDLARAVGLPALGALEESFVIVTEYNRSTQGFLVGGVDRIVNLNWEAIKPPSPGLGRDAYLTAVTELDGELVEVLDVEKVLAEFAGSDVTLARGVGVLPMEGKERRILVVDDSGVAREQIRRTLEQLGTVPLMAGDGRRALQMLQNWALSEPEQLARIALVISDIEMPEMDGYTLAMEIRKDPRLRHLPVLLHSSLSGIFNQAMVERVGADAFIAKFSPDELAAAVMKHMDGTGAGVAPVLS